MARSIMPVDNALSATIIMEKQLPSCSHGNFHNNQMDEEKYLKFFM